MTVFAPMTGTIPVSAIATSTNGGITFPAGANAMHIINTSTTLYVSVSFGSGAQTVNLGTSGISIPPMGQIIVEANPTVAFVGAIASGAGPTAVIFTPGRVMA